MTSIPVTNDSIMKKITTMALFAIAAALSVLAWPEYIDAVPEDRRGEAKKAAVVLTTWMINDLKMEPAAAAAHVEKLTRGDRASNLVRLSALVQWSELTKRHADLGSLTADAVKVWIANGDSAEAVLLRLERHDEAFAGDLLVLEERIKKLREQITSPSKGAAD